MDSMSKLDTKCDICGHQWNSADTNQFMGIDQCPACKMLFCRPISQRDRELAEIRKRAEETPEGKGFVLHARQDVLRLLRDVERLERQLADHKRACICWWNFKDRETTEE